MSKKRQPRLAQDQAGIYIRVSLDRAAHGKQDEILSPETQEDRARAYCAAQGWPVAAVERDIDESGYRQHYSQRDGLAKLLAAAESGALSKIVVWKFSRLSRRLKEFIEICDRVEAAGGGIVSVTEQVDTSTPAGRLIRNILASFAQFQSEELSEQIFETWVTIAKRGERPAGGAPFGTVNHKGILAADPATHNHLLGMFQTFRDSQSLAAVIDYLHAKGVKPKRAAEWHVNVVRWILNNPVYVGRLNWAGDEFQARWEPIVPVDLWEAVQRIFAGRRSAPVQRKDARLLTGLIRCGECGRPMRTRYTLLGKEYNGHVRVYWCAAPNGTMRKHACSTPYVIAEEVEAAAWAAACDLIATYRLDKYSGDTSHPIWGSQDRESDQKRHRLTAEKARLESQLSSLVDLRTVGDISPEEYRKKRGEYLERLRGIQAELAEIAPEPTLDPKQVRSAASRAATATGEDERRTVLTALRAEVVITPNRATLSVLGKAVKLHSRRILSRMHFGAAYHRLDYAGPSFTDRQIAFVRRTYAWANKEKIAQRIGRSYKSLVKLAGTLGLTGRRSSMEAAGMVDQGNTPPVRRWLLGDSLLP